MPRHRLARHAALLTALLVAAPRALAGDPTAAAFAKNAKSSVGVIQNDAKLAVKSVKAALKDAAAGYGDTNLSADNAMSAAVTSITSARDELEDAAFSSFTELSASGHQLLLDAGLPTPGPDFQAGGGGTWDIALASVQATLDKTDGQLNAAFAKFVKDMGKSSGKVGLEIDIRWQLPPHGEGFWTVVAPAGNPATDLTDGFGPAALPPQVLIEARFLDTNISERTRIGIRSSATEVDVQVASTATDLLMADSFMPGAGGTATGSFTTAGLAHAIGFISVFLDDGTLTSPITTLSAPHLTPADPDTDQIGTFLEQSLKTAKKDFAKAAAGAVSTLAKTLPTHIKAVGSGAATPELALRTGFGNLRDAREAISVAWEDVIASTVEDAGQSLEAEGHDDDVVPGDFQPDSSGFVQHDIELFAAMIASREKAATKAYDGFVGKVLKAAAKQGAEVGANRVIGRVQPFGMPPVTGGAAPPPAPFVAPHICDAMTLLVGPVLTGDNSVLLCVQADPAQLLSVATSCTTIPDGDLTDLGDQSLRPGGTAQAETPLVADVSILGWLFKAGLSDTNQPSLVIMTRPTIVTSGP